MRATQGQELSFSACSSSQEFHLLFYIEIAHIELKSSSAIDEILIFLNDIVACAVTSTCDREARFFFTYSNIVSLISTDDVHLTLSPLISAMS